MAFLNRDALIALISFLNKYRDVADKVIICDIGPIPEFDYILTDYTNTSYTVTPDLCARVLNTEKLLLANKK